MTPLYFGGTVALLWAQFALPIRWAFLPLLIAACHLPNIVALNLGIAGLTVSRLLILAGVARAFQCGRFQFSSRNALDVLMCIFGIWAALSSVFHHPRDHNPLSVRLSLDLEILGTYFYGKAYLRDKEDWYRFAKGLAIVLMPLAVLLMVEKATGHNVYSIVGAVLQEAWVRQGKTRASGPFGISILVGLAGATSLPIVLTLKNRAPKSIVYGGIGACLAIVVASASSGPMGGLLAAFIGLYLWRWRAKIRLIKWGAVGALFVLHLIMKAPVWYLISRIDFAGGSTGYHRAELITQAINHVDEWGLSGTDYTRHWMPYGIEWSSDHVDITNYFIKMGVLGGLPLMLTFIAIVLQSFAIFGRKIRELRANGNPAEFLVWCFGVALFAHCAAFLSVSYYDQSYVFVFLLVGAAGALGLETSRRSLNVRSASTASSSNPRPLSGAAA